MLFRDLVSIFTGYEMIFYFGAYIVILIDKVTRLCYILYFVCKNVFLRVYEPRPTLGP